MTSAVSKNFGFLPGALKTNELLFRERLQTVIFKQIFVLEILCVVTGQKNAYKHSEFQMKTHYKELLRMRPNQE